MFKCKTYLSTYYKITRIIKIQILIPNIIKQKSYAQCSTWNIKFWKKKNKQNINEYN